MKRALVSVSDKTNLIEFVSGLKELGYEKHITFDLGKVPHLNYYSG